MSISNTPVTASLAPPAQWHDHDSHGHVVQFYTEDAALLGAISRFIGTALGAGDAAVVIATRAHRDGLFLQLQERGFDVSGAVRQGRLIAVDAAETLSRFMRDGWPDPACFASVVGGFFDQIRAVTGTDRPRVAAFGEMVALLWAEGNSEAAIRLEELWNDLARTSLLLSALRLSHHQFQSGRRRRALSENLCRALRGHPG